MSPLGRAGAALLLAGLGACRGMSAAAPAPSAQPPVIVDSHLELPVGIDCSPVLAAANAAPSSGEKSFVIVKVAWHRSAPITMSLSGGRVTLATKLTYDGYLWFIGWNKVCSGTTDLELRLDFSWSASGAATVAVTGVRGNHTTSCAAGGAIEKEVSKAIAGIAASLQPEATARAAAIDAAIAAAWTRLQQVAPLAATTPLGVPAWLLVRPANPYVGPFAGNSAKSRMEFAVGCSGRPLVVLGASPAAPPPLPLVLAVHPQSEGGKFLIEAEAMVGTDVVAATVTKSWGKYCVPCAPLGAWIVRVSHIQIGPRCCMRIDMDTPVGDGAVVLCGRQVFKPHTWELSMEDLSARGCGMGYVLCPAFLEEARRSMRWASQASHIDRLREGLVGQIRRATGGLLDAEVHTLEPILGGDGTLLQGDATHARVFVRMAGRLVLP